MVSFLWTKSSNIHTYPKRPKPTSAYLSVDPAPVVAAEVGGKVGNLLDLAHPAGGVHVDGVLHHLPRGVQAREGALRLDGPGRDAVHADALAAPLHSERPETRVVL